MSSIYFMTMNTYGTWLPGDPRGSIWRGQRLEGGHRWLFNRARSLLKHTPVTLTLPQRQVALSGLLETCRFRQWTCFAANVRTQHLHTVVEGPPIGKQAAVALKGNITRILRERGLVPDDIVHVWGRGGWIEEVGCEGVEGAVRYVVEEQGENVEGTWFDSRPQQPASGRRERGQPERKAARVGPPMPLLRRSRVDFAIDADCGPTSEPDE